MCIFYSFLKLRSVTFMNVIYFNMGNSVFLCNHISFKVKFVSSVYKNVALTTKDSR